MSNVTKTYTILERSTVFSGCSGKAGGLSSTVLLGTQWNDFLMEWPICLAGDFYKLNNQNNKLNKSTGTCTGRSRL